jgi:hypothetical protein
MIKSHCRTSKFNHHINILFYSAPSWCLSPSVLLWHILPQCPLEHFKSSYLLLQICPMFFPSSCSSFVIHLLLKVQPLEMKSLQHPPLTLTSLGTTDSLISSDFPFADLPSRSGNDFTQWTNFPSSLKMLASSFITQYFSPAHSMNAFSSFCL